MRGIEYAYSKGCREFLTGGAIGFDTIAARCIIRFRISHPDIRMILVLPCINQSERWTDAQIESYNYTLASADEVIYASEEYTSRCMMERNAMLAERADILIAYVSRPDSGAAQTVRMAKQKNKEVYNIYHRLDEK
jgi:uncharacterized phage-like protein YoqJ